MPTPNPTENGQTYRVMVDDMPAIAGAYYAPAEPLPVALRLHGPGTPTWALMSPQVALNLAEDLVLMALRAGGRPILEQHFASLLAGRADIELCPVCGGAREVAIEAGPGDLDWIPCMTCACARREARA